MPYTNNGKNAMLDALAALITHASLHTAVPGEAGDNEVAGGAPAYARKSVAFGAADTGNINLSGTAVFDVPGSTTVTHVGFWSAVSAGNFYGYAAVTSETFASQGTYTLSDADLNLNA